METQYGINQLAQLTGLGVRTIRFYLQKGLLAAPHGSGRGAWYDENHLAQLIKLQKWQAAGLSLERIGELLRQEAEPQLPQLNARPGDMRVCSHLYLAPGLTLVIDPLAAGLGSDELRNVAQTLMDAYAAVTHREGDE